MNFLELEELVNFLPADREQQVKFLPVDEEQCEYFPIEKEQ